LGIFDFSVSACRALSFLTAGKNSECCFRLNGIFSRELSRSLVDKWLLVTTPIASDPPKRITNYPTAGLTAGQIPEIAAK
jgi:hypothetical protein